MNLCNKQVNKADKSTFTFTLIDQIQFNAFYIISIYRYYDEFLIYCLRCPQ